MTRDELKASVPAELLDVGVVYDTPNGIRYRTIDSRAAVRMADYGRAHGFGMTARHKRAGRVLVSRTDNRTGHAEILLKLTTV